MSKKILFIVSNAKVIGPNQRKTGVFLDEGERVRVGASVAVFEAEHGLLRQ